MDFISIIYNVLFVNANEILPGLWLGNAKSAHDTSFLTENNINVVVNCTQDIPFLTDVQSIDITKDSYDDIVESTHIKIPHLKNIRIPVNDSLLEKDILLMQHYLTVLLPQILDYYNSGKKILIHCYAGKQRSAIVVAALLYTIRSINMVELSKKELADDVFKFIVSRRPQAFTFGIRINFLKTFNRMFEIDVTN